MARAEPGTVHAWGTEMNTRKTLGAAVIDDIIAVIALSLFFLSLQAGVFGDIDLQVHRDWIERVCRESGIQPIFPLWENNRYDIMQEFIQAGFKSIVVSVRHEKMDKSWLGREIDKTFISDLQKEEHIDLCGEEGEYHTFVYDGPIFQQAVDFSTGTTFSRDNHHFIEIKSIEGDLCSEGCTSCQR